MRKYLLLCSLAFNAAAADPFFMFVAHRFDAPGEDKAVSRVLTKYFTSRDYIGAEWRKVPELSNRIPIAHTFAIPGSIEGARRAAADPQIGLVMYDIEHWDATPKSEQTDPIPAVLRASDVVRDYPGKSFGITPDGQYIGIRAGKCELDTAANIVNKVDLTRLDVVLFQSQRLLGDKCVKEDGVKLYSELISSNAKAAKKRNPKILVVAQFSFRFTPPERMIEKIRELSVEVDGVYLAYPATSLGIKCAYCSPENLERVLAAVRTR
jgi:hypothetical protein